MTSLVTASIIHWARTGNEQLKLNWTQGMAEHSDGTAPGILKQLFFGTCLAMLGLTGFECKSGHAVLVVLSANDGESGTPSYISRIKEGRFPAVFRNLHYPAIVFNTSLMLLVMATIPLDKARGGANILSVLGEMV